MRSSALAARMVWDLSPGGDSQVTRGTQLGRPPLAPAALGEERAMEDTAPMGWSTQPSRKIIMKTNQEDKEREYWEYWKIQEEKVTGGGGRGNMMSPICRPRGL